MSHPHRRATFALVTVLSLAALAPVRVRAGDRPPSEVVLEVSGVLPKGNLADDFYGTELGLGIKSGIEFGFRWRYYLGERVSLSPAFHFLNYKDFKSSTPDGEDFRINPTSFRYTVELMWAGGDRESGVRPFAALSAGLYRNRLEGFYKTYDKPFDESVNTFGAAVRAGVRLGQFELCLMVSFNRFETWEFFQTGQAESYVWDNTGARAGWVVPFGDD